MVVGDHAPMAHLNSTTNSYQGVEVKIMNVLARSLGFQPQYYTLNASDASSVQWEQENETHLETGLIGEVVVKSSETPL